MRRSLVPALLVVSATLALPQAAVAAVSQRTCPASPSGYALENFQQFYDAYKRAGGPGSLEGGQAFFAATDKNRDGYICAKDIPDTPGSPAYVGIAVDNNARV